MCGGGGQLRGREAEKAAASQMTHTAEAAHRPSCVNAAGPQLSEDYVNGSQGLQRGTLLSLKVLLHPTGPV